MGIFSSTGNVLAQASDPGSTGAGSIWSDTDSHVTYRRTDDNAQWVPIGSKVGDILFWGGTEANTPSGFAICDGTAISRTSFALLFNIIGTTFGTGDGSTTFNLPDLQTANRFPRAATNDAGVGGTGGSGTVTLTSAQSGVPAHNNPISTTESSGSGAIIISSDIFTSASAQSTDNNSAADAASSHENQPPFIDFHYIISTGL